MTTPDRRRPEAMVTHVTHVQRLSASLVRIVVTGEGLADFAPVHADSYVKVQFTDADGDVRMRTYTVRAFDPATRELTLDFVVHGDSGLAGPWAASAAVGDQLLLRGPGGGYTPPSDADWHLLVGDESALPAIAVALERMPAGADVTVLVEVHGPEDQIDLVAPVTWLHRGIGPVGSRLVEAVAQWPIPDGDGFCFVHGEAGVVKQLRRQLRVERGLPLDRLSISGYWRLGVDDEGWRQVKRDWNREVEESERAAVAS